MFLLFVSNSQNELMNRCAYIIFFFSFILCIAHSNNLLIKVARKLVLMEQDLERSEEKVELSERFVLCGVAFSSFWLIIYSTFSEHSRTTSIIFLCFFFFVLQQNRWAWRRTPSRWQQLEIPWSFRRKGI